MAMFLARKSRFRLIVKFSKKKSILVNTDSNMEDQTFLERTIIHTFFLTCFLFALKIRKRFFRRVYSFVWCFFICIRISLEHCSVFFLQQHQEQDPTNLYFANLPLNYKENDLETLLSTYGNVISTRVLRDEVNMSKGVGFARQVAVCMNLFIFSSV